MKKVFFMAALVLAGAIGSFATEMNETSLSEMTSCPVKKTTKKSTKKTTTKKSTKKLLRRLHLLALLQHPQLLPPLLQPPLPVLR